MSSQWVTFEHQKGWFFRSNVQIEQETQQQHLQVQKIRKILNEK